MLPVNFLWSFDVKDMASRRRKHAPGADGAEVPPVHGQKAAPAAVARRGVSRGDRRGGLGIAVLGAAGLWLGFPNPLLQAPVLALLYPLALLELGRGAPSAPRAFRNGLGCGILGCSACLYWISVPVHDFGHMPWAVAVPTAVALGSYLALYGGIFAAAMHWGCRHLRPLWLGVFALASWTLLEYLKGLFLSGFAWLTLSAAFVPWYPAVQGAALLGAYGLSGVFAALVVWLTEGVREKSRPALAAVLAVALGLAAFSGWRLSYFEALSGKEPLKALLVQGNINQDQKWSISSLQATIDRYKELTASGLASPGMEKKAESLAPLVIWPETAMPFLYSTEYDYGVKLRNFAREQKVYLLFGAPGEEPAPGLAQEDYPLFNRAHLIDPGGKDAGAYEKEHLVPFGEYPPSWIRLPFLDFFLSEAGDFTPGVRTTPLRVHGANLGVLICYETIFPELSRKRVEQGADALVNISNDAWFGNTAAPEQHLQLTAMRAVEEGRYLVRATNTGISSLIDPNGRILFRSELFKAEAIPVVINMEDGYTLFFYIADYLPWLFMGILALAASSRLFDRRKKDEFVAP